MFFPGKLWLNCIVALRVAWQHPDSCWEVMALNKWCPLWRHATLPHSQLLSRHSTLWLAGEGVLPHNSYKNVFIICFCNLCWAWNNRNVSYIYSHMCEEKRQTDKGLRTVKDLPTQTAAPLFLSLIFCRLSLPVFSIDYGLSLYYSNHINQASCQLHRIQTGKRSSREHSLVWV